MLWRRLLRRRLPEPKTVKGNTLQQFFGTLTSLWSRKLLFFILLSIPIANLGFGGALNTLFPVVAKDVFSGEMAYGYIMSCLGGGLFLGTMIGPLLLKKVPAVLLYSLATVVAAVNVFLFGGSHVLVFSLIVIFASEWGTVLLTMRQ